MAIVRIKRDVQAFVINPATQSTETLIPGKAYDTDDPIEGAFARTFAWAFEADNVDVEQATAAPGERRTTRKRSAQKSEE